MFKFGGVLIHRQVFFFVMAQRTVKGMYNFHLPKSASVITFTIKPSRFRELRNDAAMDKWLQVQKLARQVKELKLLKLKDSVQL